MAYLSRRLTGKRSVRAESLSLLIVVAAAAVTAYWAADTIGIHLSIIESAASALGIDESVATTHQVGYSEVRAEATQPPGAPNCKTGEQPAFLNGMAALHQQVGGAMGTPVECEHADGALGNTVQQTSTGLAAYDHQSNTETFTDGWHHWALTPSGLVTWEGTSAEPPTTNASQDGSAAASPDDGSAQVVADGASDTVAATPDDGTSQAAAAGEDDGSADAVAATQGDTSSDAVAASPDDGSDAAAASPDDGSDASAANQDDASPDATAASNDDGPSDAAVSDTQDDGSAQAAAPSDNDGSAAAATDNQANDQP